MGDDDLTVAFKDGGRCPRDVASVVQEHFGKLDDGKVTIYTTIGIKEEQGSKWQMNLQFCFGDVNRKQLLIIQVLIMEAFFWAASLFIYGSVFQSCLIIRITGVFV